MCINPFMERLVVVRKGKIKAGFPSLSHSYFRHSLVYFFPVISSNKLFVVFIFFASYANVPGRRPFFMLRNPSCVWFETEPGPGTGLWRALPFGDVYERGIIITVPPFSWLILYWILLVRNNLSTFFIQGPDFGTKIVKFYIFTKYKHLLALQLLALTTHALWSSYLIRKYLIPIKRRGHTFLSKFYDKWNIQNIKE